MGLRRRSVLLGAVPFGVAMRVQAQGAARPASGPGGRGAVRPLQIVASFSILADMVKEIAGDAAVVSMLVGPNADAHAFSPAPADVKRIASADLVVVNGLGLEGWLDRLVAASGYKGRIVVATRGLKPRELSGAPDPHAWQSLRNARLYVENIGVALKSAMPSQAAAFEDRVVDFLRRIEELDAHARARFGAIAQERRRVVTSHDAFEYLGAAYGIEFIAPQGRSTDSEASAAQVAAVIRQLRSQRVHAVFMENMTDPRLIERIAQDANARVGGKLYADALSPPGTPADTYLKMMAANIDALADAMQP